VLATCCLATTRSLLFVRAVVQQGRLLWLTIPAFSRLATVLWCLFSDPRKGTFSEGLIIQVFFWSKILNFRMKKEYFFLVALYGYEIWPLKIGV
jgi:hypothetical protein